MWKLKVPKKTTRKSYDILVFCALVTKELYGKEANILNNRYGKPKREVLQIYVWVGTNKCSQYKTTISKHYRRSHFWTTDYLVALKIFYQARGFRFGISLSLSLVDYCLILSARDYVFMYKTVHYLRYICYINVSIWFHCRFHVTYCRYSN
jgi:hypothetical protein